MAPPATPGHSPAPQRCPERSGDVFVFADPQVAGAYCYVPGPPRPEQDAQGHATVHVFGVGDGAFLQLGACWGVGEADLAALRTRLAQRDAASAATPALLRLQPAPVTIVDAALLMGAADGTIAVLQESRSAGFPPFTALFHQRLGGDQHARAMAALRGEPGALFVRYRGQLETAVPLAASINGDARPALASLRTDAGGAAARAAIARALVAGQLAVTPIHPVGIDDAAVATVVDKAIDAAATALQRLAATAAPSSAADRFAVTAVSEFPAGLPISVCADLAAWFGAAAGAQPSPSTI